MRRLINVLSLGLAIAGVSTTSHAEFFGCNDAKLTPGHVLYSDVGTQRHRAYAAHPVRHRTARNAPRYFRAGERWSYNSR